MENIAIVLEAVISLIDKNSTLDTGNDSEVFFDSSQNSQLQEKPCPTPPNNEVNSIDIVKKQNICPAYSRGKC